MDIQQYGWHRQGRQPWKAVCITLCLLMAGCSARVTHQVDADDNHASGIRYYNNAPYLIVWSDGQGGLNWQIRYLPDQSQIMVADPQVLGGRTEMTLSFQNGVLATASTVGDTTELPKAIIGAVQSALPLLLGAAEGTLHNAFPAPQLYKIVVKGDQLEFLGGKGDVDIQVPINTGKPT